MARLPQPGGPVGLVKDFGEQSTATNGVKHWSGLATTLRPGRYVLGHRVDATATFRFFPFNLPPFPTS